MYKYTEKIFFSNIYFTYFIYFLYNLIIQYNKKYKCIYVLLFIGT